MSFYRSVLAAVAAVVIASPVFADDTTTTTTTTPTGNETTVQTTSDATTTTTTTVEGKVNINKATAKELMKVKGLNASKARAIVAFRKKNGDYKTTDDLANVKGFKKMTPETLKEITDQLSVE